ncbi:MAG: GNAT family N-acetyltransferase [Thermomicrobiales bacterium]
MLETPRLLLRPMLAEDTDALLQIFADPRVMASFGVEPFGMPQMDRWVRRNLDHQGKHGYGLFSVILKESGLLVGNCGLEVMEISGAPAAELGYDFRSDHWNRGLATEAATAVRDYAFATLALPRLVSLIRQGNHASRRVAEKVGLRLTETIQRGDHPYWVYALAREDAPAR